MLVFFIPRKEKSGFVALGAVFDDLLKAEEIIKKYSLELERENLKHGIMILEGIRENLAPLAEEKDVWDLKFALEDIDSAIENLINDPEVSLALGDLGSAQVNLLRYNLRGRKVL